MTDTGRIFTYDTSFLPTVIAGMDEAGRGPLAGPVVAACVVMPLQTPIDGINDSKKVSEKKREKLYEIIVSGAIAYGVGVVDNERIDTVNILQATKQVMEEAYKNMAYTPQMLLVDAVTGLRVPVPVRSIVKGDATSYHIAAASIVAKVTRDRMMRRWEEEYPMYGFAKNKGYGTAAHIEALRSYGPCPIHRKTFIKNFIDV